MFYTPAVHKADTPREHRTTVLESEISLVRALEKVAGAVVEVSLIH